MPKGVYIRSKEYRETMCKTMKGNTHTLDKHWKIEDTSNYKKAAQKRILNPNYCKKVSENNKKRWKTNKDYRNKMIQVMTNNKNNLGKTWKVKDTSNMGQGDIRGNKNGRWQGGVSFEPYPLGWNNTFKEQIRYRDKYICQICSVPELEYYRKLDVHHIDYDKNNLDLNNLITLCQSCHSKTNHNRNYWIEYFTKINSIKL